jgi:hypothetical protein
VLHSFQWPLLQPPDDIQHLRRSVRVVMGNLPRTDFPLIDVRDAMVDRDRLAGELDLSTLDARFVGHVPNGMDELILSVQGMSMPFRLNPTRSPVTSAFPVARCGLLSTLHRRGREPPFVCRR